MTRAILAVAPALLLGFCLCPLPSRADAPVAVVEVGQAKAKKTVTAFPEIVPQGPGADARLRALRDLVRSDLEFSGMFEFLDPAAFVESKAKTDPAAASMTDWSAIGADLLIKARGGIDGKVVTLEVYAYVVSTGQKIVSKKYRAADEKSERQLAHQVSNDVFLGLTGKKGPFTSKIAFVSDHSGRKEIYAMDFDGGNRVKLTGSFLHTMAPAWSPDGKRIVFTAITKNAKNVRGYALYEWDATAGGKPTLLSDRKGINSGAVYSPDGKKLALTMSFTGNAEIYLLDVASKELSRLTTGYSANVDPSWSPDGKQLAFVSDRAGKSMIYRMDADGTNVKRLTYDGDFNATPRWSPAGDRIAFAGWQGGKVRVYLMDTDGNGQELLANGNGKDEDPDFAPGGYFLAYSSKAEGKRNIVVTNVDGTMSRPVTHDFGNCEAPRWSPVE